MTDRARFQREARGVTAIELIIVVCILGVLAAVAMPGIIGGIRRTGVDGATRQISQDLRRTQGTAVSGGVQARLLAFDSSGQTHNDGSSPDITDTALASQYRIEQRISALASWPAVTDNRGTNSNVLTEWNNIPSQYRGVTLDVACTVVFNSQGFQVTSLTTPKTIHVTGPGGAKSVTTSNIGKVSFQ